MIYPEVEISADNSKYNKYFNDKSYIFIINKENEYLNYYLFRYKNLFFFVFNENWKLYLLGLSYNIFLDYNDQ